MRTRLVVWGTNAEDQKVLIGISLLADENKIELVAIPVRDCTEEFYNRMMNEWREGADLQFPESVERRSLELTVSESILPEDFRVERSDVIQRAQMEWHFLVLSTKLYRNFKSELEDVAHKIRHLEGYDKATWDDLKSLWDSIQKHSFDKNIIRDHADSLREKSNALFEELKKLRSSVEQELISKSSAILDSFNSKIEEIHNRINTGGVLKIIFDDLKRIQEEFRSQNMVKEDRNTLIKKLDQAFNAVRDKRSGAPGVRQDGDKSQGASDRLNARLEGLDQDIKKIEKSIDFDKKDIDFENKRIASSTGQLEAQIRVAKIKMIEDRMKSKQEKLDELLKIKSSLLKSSEALKKKEEKRQRKFEEKQSQKLEEEKIRAKYEEAVIQNQQVDPVIEEKLLKAAEEIKSAKKSRNRDSGLSTETNVPVTDTDMEAPVPPIEENIVYDSSTESALDELINTALEETNNAEATTEMHESETGGSATDNSVSDSSPSKED